MEFFFLTIWSSLDSSKEGWVLKNWCFWNMVLEKTLESASDNKEIQLVHPKGNQSWILIKITRMLLFSHSVMSDSLQPHELQHIRLPCPSLSPGVCSKSSPFSWSWHSNHLILFRPLLLPPSVFLSIRVFFNESVLHIRWSKYQSFHLQHQSFQWIFRTDFL